MLKAPENFGFGPSFLRWVKTSSVCNGGLVSGKISFGRGVRQGCPLSALLFIKVVEILVTQIRNNKDICGIKVNQNKKIREIKLCQLADDTTVFVKNTASIEATLLTISHFRTVGGPVLNLTKTEGMWIGKYRESKEMPSGMS